MFLRARANLIKYSDEKWHNTAQQQRVTSTDSPRLFFVCAFSFIIYGLLMSLFKTHKTQFLFLLLNSTIFCCKELNCCQWKWTLLWHKRLQKKLRQTSKENQFYNSCHMFMNFFSPLQFSRRNKLCFRYDLENINFNLQFSVALCVLRLKGERAQKT